MTNQSYEQGYKDGFAQGRVSFASESVDIIRAEYEQETHKTNVKGKLIGLGLGLIAMLSIVGAVIAGGM